MVEQSDGEIINSNSSRKVVESEESILAREPWRKADASDREAFLEWLIDQQSDRLAHGVKEYGTVFQGQPILQGIEENLDQLFYLYWAGNQLQFVEGQRNTYRHLLESVIEFGLSEMIYTQIVEELDG